MDKKLIDAGVKFPKYWDSEAVILALTTMDSYELYDFFEVSNPSVYSRKLKPCFPNKLGKESYSKYVRELLK